CVGAGELRSRLASLAGWASDPDRARRPGIPAAASQPVARGRYPPALSRHSRAARHGRVERTGLGRLDRAVGPAQMRSREANLSRLAEGPLDVLILGGGINGAGIARDLALRSERARADLRIGLVERRQFASGTSGRNSQLIHGGLRYLKTLEFGLV